MGGREIPEMKKGGKAPRQKGDRWERECVNLLRDNGVGAERVPLSGAAGGSFTADVEVFIRMGLKKFECKSRARGFTQLYTWLDKKYGLFLKDDRREGLVVMRLSDFILFISEQW